MAARRRVSVAERRARLARRHRLITSQRTDDLVTIADSVVALHSSDPVSVYLSAMARMAHPAREAVDRALYEQRSVIRHHAMRRTLWVMTPSVARLAHAACTLDLLRPELNRSVKLLRDGGVSDDGESWLAAAGDEVLAALRARGTASTRELGKALPALTAPVQLAPGKTYGGPAAAITRVLLLLGFAGRIVRTRPAGSWINGQYAWAPMDEWLPGGIGGVDPAAARIELARRWLHAFGPATTTDLQWWMGWSVTATRHALAGIDAVEVDVDGGVDGRNGGGVGWLLPDDLGVVRSPPPWVAFLPALDPTTMGWKQRDWYLGAHGPQVFDTNGNGGPTVWADGRIVGAWAQRRTGEIAYRLLDDGGAERAAMIEQAAHRIEEMLGGSRITVRFPAPIQAALLEG